MTTTLSSKGTLLLHIYISFLCSHLAALPWWKKTMNNNSTSTSTPSGNGCGGFDASPFRYSAMNQPHSDVQIYISGLKDRIRRTVYTFYPNDLISGVCIFFNAIVHCRWEASDTRVHKFLRIHTCPLMHNLCILPLIGFCYSCRLCQNLCEGWYVKFSFIHMFPSATLMHLVFFSFSLILL